MKFEIAGKSNARLWELFGDGMTDKWIVIAVIVAAIFIFSLKDKPFQLVNKKAFTGR